MCRTPLVSIDMKQAQQRDPRTRITAPDDVTHRVIERHDAYGVSAIIEPSIWHIRSFNNFQAIVFYSRHDQLQCVCYTHKTMAFRGFCDGDRRRKHPEGDHYFYNDGIPYTDHIYLPDYFSQHIIDTFCGFTSETTYIKKTQLVLPDLLHATSYNAYTKLTRTEACIAKLEATRSRFSAAPLHTRGPSYERVIADLHRLQMHWKNVHCMCMFMIYKLGGILRRNYEIIPTQQGITDNDLEHAINHLKRSAQGMEMYHYVCATDLDEHHKLREIGYHRIQVFERNRLAPRISFHHTIDDGWASTVEPAEGSPPTFTGRNPIISPLHGIPSNVTVNMYYEHTAQDHTRDPTKDAHDELVQMIFVDYDHDLPDEFEVAHEAPDASYERR
mgnify:CR=1 FL=1